MNNRGKPVGEDVAGQPLLLELPGAEPPSGHNGNAKKAGPTTDRSSDRLAPHPYSVLLGTRSSDQFQGLVESIRQSGEAGKLVLYEGQVLWDPDRYRAAQVLGLEVRTKNFDGDDPIAFLCANLLHGLHHDAGTRAVIVADLYPWVDRGRPNKSTLTVDFASPRLLPKTTEQLAALADVGTTRISQAKEICLAGLATYVKSSALTFAEALRRIKVVRLAGLEPSVRCGEISFELAYEQASSARENQNANSANQQLSRKGLIERIEKLEAESSELRQRLSTDFNPEPVESDEMESILPDIGSIDNQWRRMFKSQPTPCPSCEGLVYECAAIDAERERLVQLLTDAGLDPYVSPVE